MQKTQKTKRHRIIVLLAAAILLWWSRALVWLVVRQIIPGALTALAALPLARILEKRFSPGVSAGIAVAALGMALATALLWLVPVLGRQLKQLLEVLPQLWEHAAQLGQNMQKRLAEHGLETSGVQEMLLQRGQEALGEVLPSVFSRIGGMAGGAGQWLLAPVFGFYFLRDRRMISAGVMRFLPETWRAAAVRLLREMRRDTAAYLRGQLVLSLAVGALSAVGLMLCGVPSWLTLGVLMGVMELIPYVGPLIGGTVVALFALPQGIWRTLWALGVVLVVQQLESSFLSPRFIGQATRLHPAVIILCALTGGAAAGVTGIVLSVPAVLCLRAALRVLMRCRTEINEDSLQLGANKPFQRGKTGV